MPSSLKKLLSSKYTAIAIILIVSIGVYLNTLPNEFVYDDKIIVLQNKWIKDVRYFPKIFLSDLWALEGDKEAFSNFYRPLMHTAFMIDYHIFGLKPWGFHLTNIIFHAGVSLLVFLITSILINQSLNLNSKFIPNKSGQNSKSHPAQVGTNPKLPKSIPNKSGQNPKSHPEQVGTNLKSEILSPAFIAALLFAAHPIHTETVACVSGIGELSFTLFYLLSFYFYINSNKRYTPLNPLSRGENKNKRWGKWIILSAVFFFLSALCKEPALTLPILLLAYDYSISRSSVYSSRFTVHSIIKRYLPFLIASGVYFILRIYAIGGFAPLKKHAELSNYEYFINVFPLFTQYLEKLILPINLNVFYVFHPISSIFQWEGIIALIITLGFIFLIYFFRRYKLVLFCLLWIVIPLLPALYIPALGENTFGERYLYLPSAGFVIIAALSIERIYQLKALRQTANYVIISILVILTGLYSLGTIKRNYIWRNDYTLWTDTVKKSPDSYIPHNNLASAYLAQQRFEDATKEYMIAVKLKPDSPDAHYNLAFTYSKQERFEEAIKEYMIAIMLKPDYTKVHNNLGNIYTKYGRFEEAIREYMIAIKLKPDSPEPHYNLALTYSKQERFEEAIKEYMIAIKLDPDSPEPHYNLALTYSKLGRFDEAIKEYTMAIKLNPNYHEAHNDLGNVYYIQGHIDKAIKHYHIAIELEPNYPEAHNNLGLAYFDKKLFDISIKHYQTALKLNPNYQDAHYNLGNAYISQGYLDKAAAEYNLALMLKPDDADARYGLGIVYLEMGLKLKAKEEFKTALKLRPDFTPAKEALESINRER